MSVEAAADVVPQRPAAADACPGPAQPGKAPPRLARRPAPAAAQAAHPGHASKASPPTCGARPTPSTSIGRFSSSCSWAAPASANRRCSTPWPAAPSPRRRSPGRPRAIRSSTTTTRSGRTGSTRPCATAGWSPTTGPRWNTRSSSIRPTSTATTANREKLEQLLPVADVVLYVGSQEKYHDQLGWDLFRKQRQRRAFAFVLNKWDRCLHAGREPSACGPTRTCCATCKAEGFENPLLFRTAAQYWVDRASQNGQAPPPPEGEQFHDLVHWLELGLTRLEIEAIKARGVSQLLVQCSEALRSACPPDLTEAAATHPRRLGKNPRRRGRDLRRRAAEHAGALPAGDRAPFPARRASGGSAA